MTKSALPGSQFPLGASCSREGTNFAITASDADAVHLCLFDPDGTETRIELQDRDGGVWHGFVPSVGHGQRYGYRVTGPYAPAQGLRSNPAKLLLDPYSRATTGRVGFGDKLLAYSSDWPDGDKPSDLDSSDSVPKGIVIDGAFAWDEAARPRRGYDETVIYELHVRGFTMAHPAIPDALRGTYAGLAHEAVIDHLTRLGVTAVELLPVHQNVPEGWLVDKGLTNYWGYNTLCYFAPQDSYSAAVRSGEVGGQVAEFKAMVQALHSAGIEVILDVVFNHTAEGDNLGPTLAYRGLDNRAYYRLRPDDPRHYFDTTGCGNSLDAGDPTTLQLILDSMRYWMQEMHVDGFRFDLAPTLARQTGSFDRVAAFFDLVAQDPVVGRAKLIAEPWDVGQLDSYELGRFPPLWREWNGRYRDTMRDFWRSQPGVLPDFATRFTGSADLYRTGGRRPSASVNFVTVHDGFTLTDLVSYNDKHNEANGEGNADGTTDNRSWNCGVEGPTSDPEVVALRGRQSRALLTTLLLSFGVPLLLAGDESGRTQGGNNNAYCQDNETSWMDWGSVDKSLLSFTTRLVELRRNHPVFRRRRFLVGAEASELGWYTPAGDPMRGANWADPNSRSVSIFLDGSDDPDRASDGSLLLDDDFLLLVNAWWEQLSFSLPRTAHEGPWRVELDSYSLSDPIPDRGASPLRAGGQVNVGPRSILVLRSARSDR